MQVSNSSGNSYQGHVLFLGAVEHAIRLREAAAAAGLGMEAAGDAADLLAGVQTSQHGVAVVQHGIPDLEPRELLECLLATRRPVMTIFLMEAGSCASDAARLTRLGAYHCADAGTSVEEWSRVLKQAAEESNGRRLANNPEARTWRRLLVGESPSIEELVRTIGLVATRGCTVLLTGETGAGRETVARAVHMASGRGHMPMVTVNCSAIPEHLLDAELFGRGDTGAAEASASAPRIGRFEQAADGTLFLDEIGGLPIDLQGKLLRVLEKHEFERRGSSEAVKVSARVIAASTRDLLQLVRQGGFREDLYYRLNVVPMQIPPLRDRKSDIPLLVRHFVDKVCAAERLPSKEVYNETVEHLCGYSWPGNVRELENMAAKAVILSGARRVLLPGDFQLPDDPLPDVARSIEQFSVPDGGINFAQVVTSFQRSLLGQALKRTNGNRTMAAGLLHMKRTTLVSKLRVLELT